MTAAMEERGNVLSLPSQDGEIVAFRLERRVADDPPLQEAGAALAALLRPVAPEPALLARQLLGRYDGIGAVLTADRINLLGVPGMTPAAADAIEAAQRASTLALRERVVRESINNWAALEAWLRRQFGSLRRECAYGLFLDIKGGLIRDELLAEGLPDSCPVHPRTVVARVLAHEASALILVHNHPSGNPTPSPADVQITRTIATVLAGIGVALHDHVIVGREDTYSMRRKGLL